MPERGAHTALGDVMTVADLLENILRPMAVSKGLETWDDLASFMSEPWYPRRIRMGKFKGTDFMDALANRDLRAWLEWLAQSTNERSANMGKWYLEQLEFCGNQPDESFIFVSTQTIQESAAGTGINTSLVIYSNPDIDVLKRAIAAVRDRLAEVEAQYTRDRNAVNLIQAKLFSLLRAQYQKRDRLKNTVFYRRTFLDAILRGEEEDANVQVEASAQANEELDSEYERASQSAESKKALTQSEEKELEQMYRKLVSLYHPDRFASDPEKTESYQKLTSAINQARDEGDIEILREIARDANGFMERNNFGTLDFSDEVQVGKLRKLLASLEAEILSVMELRNELLESAEYELYKLSAKNPQAVQAAADEHAAAIELEIVELAQEAARLEQEIEELTGAASGVE
jgi:DNA polymerase-3 subunit epsilon